LVMGVTREPAEDAGPDDATLAAFARAVLEAHRRLPMPEGLVDRCTCERWSSRCEVQRLAGDLLEWQDD
jgi:hypothetical protein